MIKSSTFNHLFFVYSSSVCEAHSVYLSSFVRHSFVLCSFARAARTVFCSSFVRHLFVFCSSFVRLPVRLAPSFI
ncbi:hypothetical protein HMPREF9072_00528 [Capnocytophaga sp. oral taxon 324 str. F0483]|nr:hypothetical protein HMPREF9072_00528 [Capnocytophaga sp. oral taxon 324 str. F0483]